MVVNESRNQECCDVVQCQCWMSKFQALAQRGQCRGIRTGQAARSCCDSFVYLRVARPAGASMEHVTLLPTITMNASGEARSRCSPLLDPSSLHLQKVTFPNDELCSMATPSLLAISKKRKRSSSSARYTSPSAQNIDNSSRWGFKRSQKTLVATEVTSLLNPFRSHSLEERAEDSALLRDTRARMIKEELGNLLRYTGPIFG